jgi:hypothetical protein
MPCGQTNVCGSVARCPQALQLAHFADGQGTAVPGTLRGQTTCVDDRYGSGNPGSLLIAAKSESVAA